MPVEHSREAVAAYPDPPANADLPSWSDYPADVRTAYDLGRADQREADALVVDNIQRLAVLSIDPENAWNEALDKAADEIRAGKS